MRSRLNLILLGVADVTRSVAFYEAVGWRLAQTSHAGFAKFDLGGVVLGLLPRAEMAQDCNSLDATGQGFGGMALAYVARHPDEVSDTLTLAAQAGGSVVKPATANAWGIAGYFKDPDGHLFEVVYEDGWVFDLHDNLRV
ncbi:VOC family protein [Silvimonas amylolytica]|uniref:Glyoxalase n=1 Tax=Silvimonas amylolytica TaxID=449663 RepID=A0ABQ2PIF2_9NEIS|nr:VOC family protein [Silvimonas amylolytica]GGP25083.1 glyoxalase [Silvimonas amylolytica]